MKPEKLSIQTALVFFKTHKVNVVELSTLDED